MSLPAWLVSEDNRSTETKLKIMDILSYFSNGVVSSSSDEDGSDGTAQSSLEAFSSFTRTPPSKSGSEIRKSTQKSGMTMFPGWLSGNLLGKGIFSVGIWSVRICSVHFANYARRVEGPFSVGAPPL